MKAKNFTATALIGIMLLTACSGNNGNTGTAKKPNNSVSTGLINNSTPDSNKSTADESDSSGDSAGAGNSSNSETAAFRSGFKYEFDSELNGIAITEYQGEIKEVTIPDTLVGLPVVKLDVGAFAGGVIKSVTIPDSVIKIDDHVFDYCTGLTSVTFGSGLTEICASAFVNCTSLTSVTLPNSVAKIGDYAFNNCSSLTNVTIPDSVTEIGYDAFVHCESINATYKGTSYDYQHIEDLYKAINGD